MDIDINPFRVHLQVKHRDRIAPFDDKCAIGIADGIMDEIGGGRPAIDEDPLVAAGRPGFAGARDIAADPDAGLLVVDRQQVWHQIASHQQADANPEITTRRREKDFAVIHQQLKADVGMRERLHQHAFLDMGILGGGRFHELAAGRQAAEKMADADIGADRTAAFAHLLHCAILDQHLGAGGGAGLPGLQVEPAHRGNARDGLPPESHRRDPLDVLGRPDLAGGMRFQAEDGVVGIHAATVIGDLDQGFAAVLALHGDPFGTGIDRVLDQFLDNGGRALDHLAGGDAVGDFGWQYMDAAHGKFLAEGQPGKRV